MATYFSIKEIAAAIGKSDDAVRRAAKKWPGGRPRQSIGGGTEYPLSDMPPEWQVDCLRWKHQQDAAQVSEVEAKLLSELPPPPPLPPPPSDPVEYEPSTDLRQREVDAKIAIIQAADRYLWNTGAYQKKEVYAATQEFLRLYRQRGLEDVQDWVYQTRPSCSHGSLHRWRKDLKEGLAAMARKTENVGRKGFFDRFDKARDFVLAQLASTPHISPKAVYRSLQIRAESLGVPAGELPSHSAVQRFLKAWIDEHPAQYSYMVSPKQWRNQHMPAFGSYSESIDALNELWELDSTRADVIWELADGKRYTVVACIDVYSRRAKILISNTSNSEAICALLRRCLLDWGAPQAVKTDNGKDYVSNHLANVLSALGINHLTCRPYSPHEKPHVERFIGTFNHSLIEMLPQYIGHNVATREQIRAREVFKDAPEKRHLQLVRVGKSIQEFQGWCDQWINWYMQQPHEGLGGKPPLERIGGQAIRTIQQPELLDILMQPAPGGNGKRVVLKSGIQIGKLADGTTAWYVAPELGGMVGDEVYVRFDDDLGRIRVYRTPACGGFICVAECPELTGINRQETAAKAKQEAKVQQQVVRQLQGLAKTLETSAVPGEILAQAEEVANKISYLPGARTPHQSEGLEAAAASLRGVAPLSQSSPEEKAALATQREKLKAEAAQREADERQTDEYWAQQYTALIRKFRGGTELTPEEIAQLQRGRKFLAPYFNASMLLLDRTPAKRDELLALLDQEPGQEQLAI